MITLFTPEITTTNHSDIISQCVSYLHKGELIIAPTDTLYGILGDYSNAQTRLALYRVKNRTPDSPFLVLVPDLDWMSRLSDTPIPDIFLPMIPGPITLILKNKWEHLYQEPTIAVRVPNDAFLSLMLKLVNRPIMAPSANKHGEPYVGDPKLIYQTFDGEVSYMVNAGYQEACAASSIIDITVNPYRILRDDRKLFGNDLLQKGASTITKE